MCWLIEAKVKLKLRFQFQNIKMHYMHKHFDISIFGQVNFFDFDKDNNLAC